MTVSKKGVYSQINRYEDFYINVFKGTNGRQKTYEIFHVYCIFYSGFMCQTTVIFGISKDVSLVLNTNSIMKLFHLQKPLSKWRLRYVRMFNIWNGFL